MIARMARLLVAVAIVAAALLGDTVDGGTSEGTSFGHYGRYWSVGGR